MPIKLKIVQHFSILSMFTWAMGTSETMEVVQKSLQHLHRTNKPQLSIFLNWGHDPVSSRGTELLLKYFSDGTLQQEGPNMPACIPHFFINRHARRFKNKTWSLLDLESCGLFGGGLLFFFGKGNIFYNVAVLEQGCCWGMP